MTRTMPTRAEQAGPWPEDVLPARALVIVAHPDDAESHAGGTVAKLVRAGTQIVYCIATNGEKGSGDPTMTLEPGATIRQEEQRRAARVMSVHMVNFFGFPDCDGTAAARRPFMLRVLLAQVDEVIE